MSLNKRGVRDGSGPYGSSIMRSKYGRGRRIHGNGLGDIESDARGMIGGLNKTIIGALAVGIFVWWRMSK